MTPEQVEQQFEELDQEDLDEAYRQRLGEEMRSMDRFDKLDWLLETCSKEFTSNLLHNLVASMTDDEFNGHYHWLCRVNSIARTPSEAERWAEFGVGA